MSKGKLGVIGGMGPQASLLFYQKLIDHTAAQTDQEHLPTLILSDSQMPDRTAALLSGDTAPVAQRLLADARTLEAWGATAIAITCNTAHAFLPLLEGELTVPVVNMVTGAADTLKALGCKRVGILGTVGTLRTGLYHKALEARGMEVLTPPPADQEGIMDLIYGQIKAGERGRETSFAAAAQPLVDKGCDRILLACTELSLYKDWHGLDDFYVDAMDLLARRCIEVCGYPVK